MCKFFAGVRLWNALVDSVVVPLPAGVAPRVNPGLVLRETLALKSAGCFPVEFKVTGVAFTCDGSVVVHCDCLVAGHKVRELCRIRAQISEAVDVTADSYGRFASCPFDAEEAALCGDSVRGHALRRFSVCCCGCRILFTLFWVVSAHDLVPVRVSE